MLGRLYSSRVALGLECVGTGLEGVGTGARALGSAGGADEGGGLHSRRCGAPAPVRTVTRVPEGVADETAAGTCWYMPRVMALRLAGLTIVTRPTPSADTAPSTVAVGVQLS